MSTPYCFGLALIVYVVVGFWAVRSAIDHSGDDDFEPDELMTLVLFWPVYLRPVITTEKVHPEDRKAGIFALAALCALAIALISVVVGMVAAAFQQAAVVGYSGIAGFVSIGAYLFAYQQMKKHDRKSHFNGGRRL